MVLLFIVKKSSLAKKHFSNERSRLIATAKIIICRQAQLIHPPSDVIKKQLNLYFCEKKTQLWKSKGRIDKANLPYSAIEPVYLPRESYITSLYILHAHRKNNHCGVEQTLTELRSTVWIPKGRLTVKKTFNNGCYVCRKSKAKPFAPPGFPSNPKERKTKPNYPFERCLTDYMGPLNYRVDNLTVSKHWILLITCLNTRAIFAEIVTSMTAKTLLHVIRRFIAVHGFPK
ncbi:hypothetical protein NECAME_07873 [Necator americanus]|uniref:Integrase zinc-binding domain-containing protein n=1 Tax=Necator americanus TaxID=51031 RepID=W2TN73_NECAM|nr:hypothetical protein NECAME_07873 [Necator americanus]ETN82581.1 hypothetical protein NECAME_07873 [Necator americanus]